MATLVKFNGGEEVVDEVERCEESNGAGGEHDGRYHEQGVSDVEHGRHRATQAVQIKHQVVDRVQEDVECNGARGKERFPPPAVILHTEVHVGEDDGNFGADNDEQHEHNEEESKDIIHAAHPDAQ